MDPNPTLKNEPMASIGCTDSENMTFQNEYEGLIQKICMNIFKAEFENYS